MRRELSNSLILYVGTALGPVFWLFDSTVHFLFYGDETLELFPRDPDELWMRTMIVALIVGFSVFAYHTSKTMLRIERERTEQTRVAEGLRHEVEIEKAKAEAVRETVHIVHDIVNNFLNNLVFFRMQAEKSEAIPEESLASLDTLISATADRINQLAEDTGTTPKGPSEPS